MKVKLTIIAENDKHPDLPEDKAYLEKQIANAWELMCYLLKEQYSDDPSEKVTVEKCEIVEV